MSWSSIFVAHRRNGSAFFFDAVDGVAVNRSVLDALHLGIQHLQRRGKEATGSAGKVRNRLAELGLDHLHHEVRDRTGV